MNSKDTTLPEAHSLVSSNDAAAYWVWLAVILGAIMALFIVFDWYRAWRKRKLEFGDQLPAFENKRKSPLVRMLRSWLFDRRY